MLSSGLSRIKSAVLDPVVGFLLLSTKVFINENIKTLVLNSRNPTTGSSTALLMRLNPDESTYQAILPGIAEGGNYDIFLIGVSAKDERILEVHGTLIISHEQNIKKS